MKISATQLSYIVPSLQAARSEMLTGLINEIGTKYGIDTRLRLAAFIAQVAHESAGFTAKTENLNYSAKRLLQVFPKYFKDVVEAGEYSNRPESIANKVYAGRMGNGDSASGDGFNYRGGGFIQITGKDIYLKYAKYLRMPVSEVSKLVRMQDRWAMDSAAWLFAIEKALLDEADKGDLITITKRINGGLTGQKERAAIYDRALKVLKR